MQIIEAARESFCEGCEKTINAGERIGLVESEGEWMHEDCAREYEEETSG